MWSFLPTLAQAALILCAAMLTSFVTFGQMAGPQVPSASAPLSLDDVIHRAEANEPAFAAAAAEGRATALERKDARAALLPSASYHNQYLFTQSNHTHTTLGTAGGQYVSQGGVEQSLPVFVANNSVHEYYSQGVVNETVGLAQMSAVRLANANAARAQAELEIARRGLINTVVALYYGFSSAGEKVAIARRALDEANRFVDITRKREVARESAHADVIKAQLQQQQRQRELADTQLSAERARLELGVLLFPDPATPYSLAAADAPPLLPEREAVNAAARENNPELRRALALVQVGNAETQGAQAALLPDLALNFTYGIDAPQFARSGPDGARNLGYSASATVDIPVWDWLTTERKVKEARIRAEVARVEVSAAQRRLLADLAEFYDEANVARQQLASLDGSVVDARESLRLTNLRYVDGESSVLDVVDAQNTLISAETARTDGVVRYRLALAQLQTLTGRL
jgi:outer membrane protein TolC